jgi:hypothetical protein
MIQAWRKNGLSAMLKEMNNSDQAKGANGLSIFPIQTRVKKDGRTWTEIKRYPGGIRIIKIVNPGNFKAFSSL